MNAVGVDVSKDKSTIAVLRPFGEVVASPFDVAHTGDGLKKLVEFVKSLGGETRVVMEYTGTYYLPIANALHNAGVFVAVVHAQLIHDFGDNTIRRRRKTDKKDAVKIASYTITNWLKLPRWTPEEETRQALKIFNRQYSAYGKTRTSLKNNLIALLDVTFPGVNTLFSSRPRMSDGHQKWLDFAMSFWHVDCVRSLTLDAFADLYHQWCKDNDYNFSKICADKIYKHALKAVGVLPKNSTTELLITQAVIQLNHICETIAVVAQEMIRLSRQLPEYETVLGFHGVGDLMCAQLIAEVGDVRRFAKKSSLVSFAGLEPGDDASGRYKASSVPISKQGSPHLRKSLFVVMTCLLQTTPAYDPIFQFLDRKRAEGKPYYIYMNAGSAKMLRIYYARVMEQLSKNEHVNA